jgi:CTP synthase (UTP-ammonia lyase)
MAPKKCKTENDQKRKNFMAANTIMAPGFTIRSLQGGVCLINYPMNQNK